MPSKRSSNAGATNVADSIHGLLTLETVQVLLCVGRTCAEHQESAYLVGGPVRDLLLGLPSADVDVAVDGDALRLASELGDRLGAEVVKTQARFGTATLRLQSQYLLDLAMTRRETYAGTAALPEVEPASIHDDLSRRDFTINALAVDLSPDAFGDLIDVANGVDDARAGTLRVLHERSFLDDPTRIFRLVRFAGRLAFRVHGDTSRLLREAIERQASTLLSGARVREELFAVLDEPRALDFLRRLDELGVLTALAVPVPYGKSTHRACQRVQTIARAGRLTEDGVSIRDALLMTWLGTLGAEFASAAVDWLMLGSSIAAGLSTIAERRDEINAATRVETRLSVWHRLLQPLHAAAVLALVADLEHADRVLEPWFALRDTRRLLSGRDLFDLGYKPGPAFSDVLDVTFAAQLDGEVSDASAACALARRTMDRILEQKREGSTCPSP